MTWQILYPSMRGSIISSKIRSGCSSATAAKAVSPSPAVTTRMRSRCSVSWTILRTVALSSTTSTTGSLTLHAPSQTVAPLSLAIVGWRGLAQRDGAVILTRSAASGVHRRMRARDGAHLFLDLVTEGLPKFFQLPTKPRRSRLIFDHNAEEVAHELVQEPDSIVVAFH